MKVKFFGRAYCLNKHIKRCVPNFEWYIWDCPECDVEKKDSFRQAYLDNLKRWIKEDEETS